MTQSSTTYLRSRPDVIIVAQDGSRGKRFTVKDPISLEYFQFGEREVFLLDQLRTPKSIVELQQAYEQRFAPEQISPDQLLHFCASMHDCSLLVSDGSGQGVVRTKRTERGMGKPLEWLMYPLAIRFPGVDPTPILKSLDWFGRIAFSRFGAASVLVFMLVTSAFLLGRAEELVQQLYLLTDLFRPEYAAAAVLAVALLKTWHELGHGLACRRFGGECHEIGVMLLMFLPCLYCDVSDSWMLRDRWRRAVVALGGVYFELMLALAAIALWLVLAPGFLKVLCLYIALVASLSTLLINLNPFLRFDGYYLLSDAWGVPNLYEQSRKALWQPLQQWIAGGEPREQVYDAHRGLLAGYAIAAIAQFAILIAGSLWAIYRQLAHHDLRPVGDALVAMVLIGLLFRFGLSVARAYRHIPITNRWRSLPRWCAVAAGITACLWFGSRVVIEQSLWSPCRIETVSAAHLTAPVAGELIEGVSYGESIDKGETIAVLRDPSLELRLLELQGEEAEVSARLVGLRALAQRDAELFSEISVLETRQLELQRQESTIQELIGQLTLQSPRAGIVMRGPSRPAREGDDLDPWTGAPLDSENRGCCLESGELICMVGDTEAMQAVILLDESDSGLARHGNVVRIALDRFPGQYVMGRIEEIALASSEDERSRPQNSSDLAAEEALKQPLKRDRTYRVRVLLDQPLTVAQHGAVGQARIVTGRETIGNRVVRWLRGMVMRDLGSS